MSDLPVCRSLLASTPPWPHLFISRPIVHVVQSYTKARLISESIVSQMYFKTSCYHILVFLVCVYVVRRHLPSYFTCIINIQSRLKLNEILNRILYEFGFNLEC